MSPTERSRRDATITANLLAYLGDAGVDSVAAYHGLPGEPGGPDLPLTLDAAGFRVWLPVTAQPAAPLVWRRYHGPGTTRPGRFGIQEPVPRATGPDGADAPSSSLFTRVDTLVLPALAVDADGVRLGQGGGFYDRSIADLPKGGTLGSVTAIVDHEEFGVDVPRTTLDIAVATVITDKGVHRIGP